MNYVITLIKSVGFWPAIWLLLKHFALRIYNFVTNHKKYFKWGGVLFTFITAIIVIFNLWVFTKYIPHEEMKTQKIENAIEVKELVFEAKGQLSPTSYFVQAGDKIQIYASDDFGFFVDGNFQAGAFPPYSDDVFLVMEMPDEKKYRLSDKITRIEVKKGGEVKFSIGFKEQEDFRVFTGSNLTAQRLSEFRLGEIEMIFARMERFDGEVMTAKEILPDEPAPSLDLPQIALKQEEFGESMEKARQGSIAQWEKPGWDKGKRIVELIDDRFKGAEKIMMDEVLKNLETSGGQNTSRLEHIHKKWFGREIERVSP